MLGIYFKTAWRNLTRYKGYTIINVLGLTLGICAFVAIYLIARHEFSFDSFHPDKDRIYRIMEDNTESTGEKLHFARVPFPVPFLAQKELTGLDAFAGVMPFGAKISVPGGNMPAKDFDGGAVIAQPTWFTVFSYQWLAGSESTNPFTVVLSESKARKYFGPGPLDAFLGRIVMYDSLRVQVSGIVKDWDQNTDFPFTDFISFSTLQSDPLRNTVSLDSWYPHDMPILAFAKLSKGARPAQINAQMATLVKRHADPGLKMALWLEPLSDIHFNVDIIENTTRTAHRPTLYVLIGIAIFILMIAVINFVNLSTVQSIQRSKEIGIRKILGGSKASVISQFLIETFLVTFLAMVLAVLLVNPVLGEFRSFLPPGLAFHLFSPSTLIFLVLVTLATTLLAGIYPARALASNFPVSSLKGTGIQKGSEKWYLRKGLIVFQFSISLVFIIGSIVIAGQLNYVRYKDLGFKSDAIITVGMPGGDSLSKARVLAERIKEMASVGGVALEGMPPGNARGMVVQFQYSGMKDTRVGQVDGNEDFIPLYQIKLLAGRNLEHSDSVTEFVINETLSREMGCKRPEEAIGQTIYWLNKPYPVVGVVADFNSQSLHAPITPLCIINRVDREGEFGIKLSAKGKQPENVKATIMEIGKLWKSIYPDGTFKFQFYDESIALLYEKDQNAATLMNTAMLITIFISCMGLFGLVKFSAEKRTKEIGIRKVLGASVANIAVLISRDFVVLVAIAILIASPVAWYFMDKWLDGFAYRIGINWWIFVLAGAGAIFIALLTVSFQTIRAAKANPINSLRI